MKNSHSGVSERLRYLISIKDMTIQGFADFIGVPKGTLEKYINGPRLPKTEFLSMLYSQMGVSAHWLLDGIEPMYLADIGKLEAHGVVPLREGPYRGPKHLSNEGDERVNGDFISIQRFDVDASAGDGALAETEIGTGHYAFNRSWLERRGLQPDNLAVIAVRGDSMEPELYDKDLILLDQTQKEPRDGDMYVVRHSNELFVKRIQKVPGGQLALRSTNHFYESIRITPDESTDLEFIGKVVASMHEW